MAPRRMPAESRAGLIDFAWVKFYFYPGKIVSKGRIKQKTNQIGT